MSGDAGTWARAQPCADRNAKQVLVHLAAYADAEGYAWVKVPLLALEMEASARTVQRGIKAAIEFGLLEETGQKKLHLGRLIPIYRLPMERGPANTRQRLEAERVAAWGDRLSPQACGQLPTGDTDVTPRGDNLTPLGVTPVSPHHLKDPRNLQENSQNAREDFGDGVVAIIEATFGRAWSAWAELVPDGVARPLDLSAWVAACEATGDPAGLERAALRYLDRSPAVRRGRGKSLTRWLAEEGWLAWIDAELASEVALPRWGGPPAIRAAAVRRWGEGFARSWIDPCAWDDGRRAILARTAIGAERLQRQLSAELAEVGVADISIARVGAEKR